MIDCDFTETWLIALLMNNFSINVGSYFVHRHI